MTLAFALCIRLCDASSSSLQCFPPTYVSIYSWIMLLSPFQPTQARSTPRRVEHPFGLLAVLLRLFPLLFPTAPSHFGLCDAARFTSDVQSTPPSMRIDRASPCGPFVIYIQRDVFGTRPADLMRSVIRGSTFKDTWGMCACLVAQCGTAPHKSAV